MGSGGGRGGHYSTILNLITKIQNGLKKKKRHRQITEASFIRSHAYPFKYYYPLNIH